MALDLSQDKIYLKCVQEGAKLRVKIITPGYYAGANCQFPRNLRVRDRIFSIPPSDVTLITTRGKYYYSVKNTKNLMVVSSEQVPLATPPNIKIYEDIEQEECLICYDAPKQSVFNPCGHFYTCHACSLKLVTCPICRIRIQSHIDKKDMD